MTMATTTPNEDHFCQTEKGGVCPDSPTVRFAANIAETLIYDDPPSQYDNSDDLFATNSPPVSSVHTHLQEQQQPASRLVEVIRGQLYFLPSDEKTLIEQFTRTGNYRFTRSNVHKMYASFCDDFGPVAICQVIHFCRSMSKILQSRCDRSPPFSRRRKVVYYCEKSPRRCANMVFLIASYLVLELGWKLDDAMKPFDHLDPSFTEPFRDATWINPPQHLLSVRDCVKGLLKALANGWLNDFDEAQYARMADPFLGDVNSICPKFFAFKGPVVAKDIRKGDLTSFPPHFYVHIFKRLDVECVIRLNEPSTYDPAPFEEAGIMHYDLFFEDCTAPSFELVTKFLDICDKHPGKIAVHCAAGLGRTDTMLAVWLMRTCRFRANEAMGFLRVMRPGSVIGLQQTFLQHLENASWNNNTPLPASMRHDLNRVRSLDERLPSFKSQRFTVPSSSAESHAGSDSDRDTTQSQVRRVQSEPGPTPVTCADNLFGGLMRVQKQAAAREQEAAEQALAGALGQEMAAHVREAMLRRAASAQAASAIAGAGFRDATATSSFTLSDAESC